VIAKVPLGASMLEFVGSGPRWNGLSAATAGDADIVPLTRADASVSAASPDLIR
jgi:hypothetical protein